MKLTKKQRNKLIEEATKTTENYQNLQSVENIISHHETLIENSKEILKIKEKELEDIENEIEGSIKRLNKMAKNIAENKQAPSTD